MSSSILRELRKEWDIHVVRIDGMNTGELEHICVPTYRMSEDDLEIFLKALLAKHSNQDADSLLENFVNKRRGEPFRRSSWNLRRSIDTDKKLYVCGCGEKPLFAWASLPMSDEQPYARITLWLVATGCDWSSATHKTTRLKFRAGPVLRRGGAPEQSVLLRAKRALRLACTCRDEPPGAVLLSNQGDAYT